MATSGNIIGSAKKNGSVTSRYVFWAEWKRNSYSIENNTSNITVTLKIKYTYSSEGAWNRQKYPSVTLNVNGAAKTPTIDYIDTRNYAECTFATWTGNVSHNADGSLNCPISASFTHYGSESLNGGDLSGFASIDTIPRTSEPTLNKTSVRMGDSVTITTNRKSTSFTHTLTYAFGGTTGTIATGVGDSYVWTVPDLAAKIAGSAAGSCVITCQTYSGSSLIGTNTVSITLVVPDRSIPSFSATEVQMGDTVTITTNRKSTAFTHTLTYKIGDYSGTIGTGVTTSKEWTPSVSLAARTGNKTSAVCEIICDTYNGTALTGTTKQSITLTVPDATVPQLSASQVDIGQRVDIYLPKKTYVYTHDLTYTFAGEEKTIATDKNEIYQWTVPLELASKIKDDTEGTLTIKCVTRFQNSESIVGTETVSLTVKVPNNSDTQPGVTMTVTPIDSYFDGLYLVGKSKVKVSYDAHSDYSDIESYLTEMLGYSGNTNPYTSPVLVNAGTVYIKGTVTDSRGYSTEKNAAINVIDYSRPRIVPGEGKSKIICTRCNSDGNVDPAGVYLLIQVGRKYSKVMNGDRQNNYCKLSYQWKTDAQDESEYSDAVELLAKTDTSDYVDVRLPNIVTSNTIAYSIKLIAEDDVGETDTVTIIVPSAFATFHVPPGGHGFTLGGYHDPAMVDAFVCWFDAHFNGDVIIGEKTLREYILSVINGEIQEG